MEPSKYPGPRLTLFVGPQETRMLVPKRPFTSVGSPKRGTLLDQMQAPPDSAELDVAEPTVQDSTQAEAGMTAA